MKSWICWLRGSSRGSSDGVPWIFFPYRRPLPYCKERQHVLQISNSLFLAIELLGTWEHRLWYERISIFPSAYFPISIIFFISFYLRCVVNLSLPLLFYFASCTLIHPLVRVTLNLLQLSIYAKGRCRTKRDWNWRTTRRRTWLDCKRCFRENGNLSLCRRKRRAKSTRNGISWKEKSWTVKKEPFGTYIGQW